MTGTIADIRETAGKLACRLDPDPAHARQVNSLSLMLYDEIEPLHDLNRAHSGQLLSPRDRLDIAAWLHDIGWSKNNSKGHHKNSYDMILSAELPGLPPFDRLLCALIARYHRKSDPDPIRHEDFADLDANARNQVEWLAGILRVGDGLDRTHNSIIRGVSCKIDPNVIYVYLKTDRSCASEIMGAKRKAALLERKTGRILSFYS